MRSDRCRPGNSPARCSAGRCGSRRPRRTACSLAHGPVITRTQVEHPRRRERRPRAEHTVRIGIWYFLTTVMHWPSGVGLPASTRLLGRHGCVGLLGAVHRARALERQALGKAGDELDLEALDPVTRPVDGEGRVAQVHRIEQRQLNVLPLHVVGGHVDHEAMLEELALEADLVVDQLVRVVAQRLIELAGIESAGCHRADSADRRVLHAGDVAAVLRHARQDGAAPTSGAVEATRTEALASRCSRP